MLIGNNSTQQVLNQILDKLLQPPPFANFFLIQWPRWVGKTTFVRELIQKPLIQKNLLNIGDVRELIDYGRIEGKTLPIKIEEKQDFVEIGEQKLPIWWVRDLLSWAYLKPIGKYKFLLIQEMERMTLNAANGFLKLLEEPPSYLLIFATTTQKQKLLDTIVSRAFLLKMQLVDNEILKQALAWMFGDIKDETLSNVLLLSQGKPAMAIKILQQDMEEELMQQITRLKSLWKLKWFYWEKVEVLQRLLELLGFDNTIDMILQMLFEDNLRGKTAQKILDIKKFNLNSLDYTNINFLMYLILLLEEQW